ncbi:MAG: hypothetical protein EOO77_47165 [Oxalobacteraceae bacterium]|nr:MAG: hypothetical protein EOO77_47165 [Oxalobacteraceae bacterium]
MSRTLRAPDGQARVVAPTTTTKIATRMLAASAVVAAKLPVGFYHPAALDTLLALHVAEEAAQYLPIDAIAPAASSSPETTKRWIAALVQADLIEQKNDLLALSTSGHQMVTGFLTAIYDAQRALD